MLTSMVKRVDVAVYNLARQTHPGVTVLGLKEGGVDYALDQYNDKLLTPDMRRRVEDAKAQIIAGKIKVVASKGVPCSARSSCKTRCDGTRKPMVLRWGWLTRLGTSLVASKMKVNAPGVACLINLNCLLSTRA